MKIQHPGSWHQHRIVAELYSSQIQPDRGITSTCRVQEDQSSLTLWEATSLVSFEEKKNSSRS
jgi:hypothetical protein